MPLASHDAVGGLQLFARAERLFEALSGKDAAQPLRERGLVLRVARAHKVSKRPQPDRACVLLFGTRRVKAVKGQAPRWRIKHKAACALQISDGKRVRTNGENRFGRKAPAHFDLKGLVKGRHRLKAHLAQPRGELALG